MPKIDLAKLKAHRSRTFRLPPARPVTSPEQALNYVNERGFIYFWPISGVDLPSLWSAVAGNRPVADEHDDPGHITWGWKDNSLDKKQWYYAKILRRKATFISLKIAPYFYALSDNYGSPEEDHIIAYEEGRLTMAAKQVYDALLEKGSMNTIDLRKESRLQNAKESEFNRALEDLQKDFKILPVGIAEAGAWRYSYRYELTARHFPDLLEQARPIGEAEARRRLVELYLRSVGATQMRDLIKLFGWPVELVKRTVDKFLQGGDLVEAEHPKNVGVWLALKELVK
jgi:DNA glycosylase AlkZ-like